MCGIQKIRRSRLAGGGVGPFDAHADADADANVDAGGTQLLAMVECQPIDLLRTKRNRGQARSYSGYRCQVTCAAFRKSVGAGLLAKASVRLASMPLTTVANAPTTPHRAGGTVGKFTCCTARRQLCPITNGLTFATCCV